MRIKYEPSFYLKGCLFSKKCKLLNTFLDHNDSKGLKLLYNGGSLDKIISNIARQLNSMFHNCKCVGLSGKMAECNLVIVVTYRVIIPFTISSWIVLFSQFPSLLRF